MKITYLDYKLANGIAVSVRLTDNDHIAIGIGGESAVLVEIGEHSDASVRLYRGDDVPEEVGTMKLVAGDDGERDVWVNSYVVQRGDA